jgi:hypothetical protein
MVFANAEGFWKPPNLYDTIGVVGFAVGLASIWLSWWLARRDIRSKIEVARRDALGLVDRVTTILIQTQLAESLRCLRDVRDAIRRKDWARAMIRRDDVEYHLLGVAKNNRFTNEEANLLQQVMDDLAVLGRRVGKVGEAPARKGISAESKEMLEGLITAVGRIEARLRSRLLEGDHV